MPDGPDGPDDDRTRARLAAVFDRIVPDDGWPAASEAGLFDHLDRLAVDPLTAPAHRRILELVGDLDEQARADHGGGVDEVAASTLDDLLAAMEWSDRDLLVQAAAQAYYGSAFGVGARMIGYRAQPGRGPAAPVVEPVLATTPLGWVASDGYDVVVLGAGAGGGVAASVLA
ncbi:MAG TPA: gluconate 2-dehydrogenase subunit 3 family protein, partial [Acidimicrobiales bacterium]|nr:gluconate 2-dehydrogenase subunit 3 family protein [Acidimicrobiales bacterium]